MRKKTALQTPGNRQASPNQPSGLVAEGQKPRQSGLKRCALDNRSHRTPRGLPDRPKAGTRSRPLVRSFSTTIRHRLRAASDSECAARLLLGGIVLLLH